MANILIIEDDPAINELIKRSLNMTGHSSFQAFTGMEAVDIVQKEEIDLALLDVGLPDIDGFQVIKFLEKIPIIYVTARDEIADRVKGLNLGAEDYVIKPFDIQELLARVQVVLRRDKKEDQAFRIGDVTVNLKEQTIWLKGRPVAVTHQEFELLKVMIVNKNIALSRAQLLNAAWGGLYEGDERTVDAHVQRLRKKLGLEDSIKTIYKVGYRLEV